MTVSCVRHTMSTAAFLMSKGFTAPNTMTTLGRRFFSNLEGMVVNDLSASSLKSLLKGKYLAIVIPDFSSAEVCHVVAKRIFAHDYEYYTYAQGVVGRYGMSFSEVGENAQMFTKYYTSAISSVKNIRNLFVPYISPIDKLRLELQETWPKGAVLESFHPGHKMFVGLCRVIDQNKQVLPHQDMIHWDAKGEALVEASKIINQLAVNVYLQMPPQGGELELWNFGIRELSKYEQMAEGTYGIEKSKLPPPTITLKPKIGDLIIFCPQRLHCILPGSEKRLTMSSFIGYRGKEFPLSFWS